MTNHKVCIGDIRKDHSAKVTSDGALTITISPTLGVEERITSTPFTQFATINGDGVTSALNVDGSVTPVSAFVTGNQDGDFYITSANILISDNAALQLNKFGANPALINGIDAFYETAGANIKLATVRTNFDFVRLGVLTASIGGKTDAFQIANADIDNNDSYNPIIDISRLSPYGIGIRIRKNSIDKFGVVIKDNLTALSSFNILFTGYLRLINEEGE